MKPKFFASTGLAIALVVGALSLSGCTINLGTSASPQPIVSSEDFSSTDLMFAQMMIPHHQQAVEMSRLAATRTTNAQVLQLASQIEAAQQPEIEQMTLWLGGDVGAISNNHSMHMGGMLSDADMSDLKNSQGSQFDRLYLEGMIAHHEGAIQMAFMISDSKNSEARDLGQAIISSQTKEIEEMKAILASK